MSKCLIIIADANQDTYTHKSILPTIKRQYTKKNWQVDVINLYREGFDITDPNANNAYVKSYKHLVKSAHHIHFIPTTGIYGFSAMMIAFFEQVLTEGFAYEKKKGLFKSSYKPQMTKKDAWFHVSHTKTKATKLNVAWIKLKQQTIPTIFKDAEILQYGLECNEHATLYKKLKSLTDSLEDKIKDIEF